MQVEIVTSFEILFLADANAITSAQSRLLKVFLTWEAWTQPRVHNTCRKRQSAAAIAGAGWLQPCSL